MQVYSRLKILQSSFLWPIMAMTTNLIEKITKAMIIYELKKVLLLQAAKYGDLDFIKDNIEMINDSNDTEFKSKLVENACKVLNIEMLECLEFQDSKKVLYWIISSECSSSEIVFQTLDKLYNQWGNKYTLNHELFEAALMREAPLPIIKWLCSVGCPIEKQSIETAITVDCFEEFVLLSKYINYDYEKSHYETVIFCINSPFAAQYFDLMFSNQKIDYYNDLVITAATETNFNALKYLLEKRKVDGVTIELAKFDVIHYSNPNSDQRILCQKLLKIQ